MDYVVPVFTGVMTSNKYVVGNEDKSFYYYTEPLILEKFKEIIQDLERKYTYQEILTVLEKNINKIEMPRGDKALVEYVEFFKKNYKKVIFSMWQIYGKFILLLNTIWMEVQRKPGLYRECFGIYMSAPDGSMKKYYLSLK